MRGQGERGSLGSPAGIIKSRSRTNVINDGDGGGGVGGGSGERNVIVVGRERTGREGLALAYNAMVRRTLTMMVMTNLVVCQAKYWCLQEMLLALL